MSEQQIAISEKMVETLTTIGLDIREIKTTMMHFDKKFDRVQEDLNEYKEYSKELRRDFDEASLKLVAVIEKQSTTEKDVLIINQRIDKRDLKQDSDRKWLVGTIIMVIGLVITVVGLVVNNI